MPALFVTGTDTGVGKTVATALLTRALRNLGADCVAMKPLASGSERVGGVLQSEDAAFLCQVGGFEAPAELVCPVQLELPLAPLVAAEQTSLDTRDWPHQITAAFEELKRRHDWVIVEGVGGWHVPIYRHPDGQVATCADLVALWQLPVVVVARRTLGTINHTALTCRAVRDSAELTGVIFCDSTPIDRTDIAALTSPQSACELADTRQLAHIPYTSDWSAAAHLLEPFARELLQINQLG